MKKVLIVDDHAGILQILSLEIKQNGYWVITANNGKEGLEKTMVEHPDLILLDITMPLMDGFEMLSLLRECSSVPVIVHSFNEHNKEVALKLGADDFVLKPYDIDKLLEKIERVINQPVR